MSLITSHTSVAEESTESSALPKKTQPLSGSDEHPSEKPASSQAVKQPVSSSATPEEFIMPVTIDGIRYEYMTSETISEAARVLTRAYFSDPKTRVSFEVEDDDYKGFEQKFIDFPRSICEIITSPEASPAIIARDIETKEIIGVVVVSERFTPINSQGVPFSPTVRWPEQFEPLIKIVEMLNAEILKAQPHLNSQNTVHLFIQGVVPEYRGKKIALRLANFLLAACRQSGFEYAVGEASTAATQNYFQNYFGFKVVSTIDYSTFEYNGKKVYDNIGDHGNLASDGHRLIFASLAGYTYELDPVKRQ